jgi:hypothetical protein
MRIALLLTALLALASCRLVELDKTLDRVDRTAGQSEALLADIGRVVEVVRERAKEADLNKDGRISGTSEWLMAINLLLGALGAGGAGIIASQRPAHRQETERLKERVAHLQQQPRSSG